MTDAPNCPVADDPTLPIPPDHEAHRKGKPPTAKEKFTGGRLGVYPCAIPGVSLTNYSQNAQGKGWGAPCTQARTTITLSNGVRLTVATRVALMATLILNECIRRGYVIRQADTGAYNCRYISGTTVWSNHAWALAIDVNWQLNPMKKPLTTNMPPWMVQLFNRYGWAWGGDYTDTPDAMHYEFMGTPSQADVATALCQKEITGGGGPVVNPPDPNDDFLELTETGPAVLHLQDTLNRWFASSAPIATDGVFGDSTLAAVKRVQTNAGVDVDGVVGPQVRGILGLPAPADYVNKPFLFGEIQYVYSHLPAEIRDIVGTPASSVAPCADGRGRYAVLTGGLMYWQPELGAYAVWGGIREAWAATGYERGPLGYPTSNEFHYAVYDRDGNPTPRTQANFWAGYIMWYDSGASVFV